MTYRGIDQADSCEVPSYMEALWKLQNWRAQSDTWDQIPAIQISWQEKVMYLSLPRWSLVQNFHSVLQKSNWTFMEFYQCVWVWTVSPPSMYLLMFLSHACMWYEVYVQLQRLLWSSYMFPIWSCQTSMIYNYIYICLHTYNFIFIYIHTYIHTFESHMYVT